MIRWGTETSASFDGVFFYLSLVCYVALCSFFAPVFKRRLSAVEETIGKGEKERGKETPSFTTYYHKSVGRFIVTMTNQFQLQPFGSLRSGTLETRMDWPNPKQANEDESIALRIAAYFLLRECSTS